MAAEMAVPLSTRKVIVLHTKTVPMGISAMLAFDPEADTDSNAIAMSAAADRVSTGQITFAARDSDFDGFKIKAGDILAMENGKLSFTDGDFIHAATRLTKNMVTRDTSFVTLFYGDSVTEQQAETVKAQLEEKIGSEVEISIVNGGQPIYYFIISVE